jgi:glycosyltransferase involved in cell wall biosynthesis
MFRNHQVTVVIPAYNEEETIAQVVEDYLGDPMVDEVLVVDNNCKDATAERARGAGARVIEESEPGYGKALMAGMRAAKGDMIILTEADGSFKAHDVEKVLAYLLDAGMVVGTRTTRQLVQQAANMGRLLRWGNVFMAKYLELLWYIPHEPRFTDVGCTCRGLWKETFQKIEPSLHRPGPAFSPAMMCEALMKGFRVIEIPVHYYPRLGGESKHSASFWKVCLTAWGMFKAISAKRFLGR